MSDPSSSKIRTDYVDHDTVLEHVEKKHGWWRNPDTSHKYAVQMASQLRGHALYNPYPGTHGIDIEGGVEPNPRVEIGDVGYVEKGTFRLLFNIHLEGGHPRQIRGVPQGFAPIPRNPRREQHGVLPCPQVIHSCQEKSVELGAGVSVPVGPGLSTTWSIKRQRGASLGFFDRYETVDTDERSRYEDHFRKNHGSWLEFAISQRSGLTLENLILVTGCDRTRAWATLWNESRSTSGSMSLVAQIPIASINLTGSVKWAEVSTLPTLAGPPDSELSALVQKFAELFKPSDSIPDTSSTSSLSPTTFNVLKPINEVPADQCCYLRGLRGKTMSRWSQANPFRMRGGCGLDDESNGDGEQISSSPDQSLVSMALEIIEDYYDPSCDNGILIMHDDDLGPYLPRPGDEEHERWVDNIELVYPYLRRQLTQEDKTPAFIRRGAHWTQRYGGIDSENHPGSLPARTTVEFTSTTVETEALSSRVEDHLSTSAVAVQDETLKLPVASTHDATIGSSQTRDSALGQGLPTSATELNEGMVRIVTGLIRYQETLSAQTQTLNSGVSAALDGMRVVLEAMPRDEHAADVALSHVGKALERIHTSHQALADQSNHMLASLNLVRAHPRGQSSTPQLSRTDTLRGVRYREGPQAEGESKKRQDRALENQVAVLTKDVAWLKDIVKKAEGTDLGSKMDKLLEDAARLRDEVRETRRGMSLPIKGSKEIRRSGGRSKEAQSALTTTEPEGIPKDKQVKTSDGCTGRREGKGKALPKADEELRKLLGNSRVIPTDRSHIEY